MRLILLALVAALPSAPSPEWLPTIRAGHPAVTAADARRMPPAAIGDALLAPGHPRIVAVTPFPGGVAPPSGSPITLRIALVAVAAMDRTTGFCRQRTFVVTTLKDSGAEETITESDGYRLPNTSDQEGCGGDETASFAPAPADRPRAFQVVRLVAAAARAARRARPTFPITVEDVESREANRLRAADPQFRSQVDEQTEMTDGRAALAGLALEATEHVGHDSDGGDLLSPAPATGNGTPRERWRLMIGDGWTVDVALDGDRIAAMALRRAIPAPF